MLLLAKSNLVHHCNLYIIRSLLFTYFQTPKVCAAVTATDVATHFFLKNGPRIRNHLFLADPILYIVASVLCLSVLNEKSIVTKINDFHFCLEVMLQVHQSINQSINIRLIKAWQNASL